MSASYPTYKSTSIPWLPEIPEHWELRRNKYLLKEINERSLDGEEELLSVSQYTGVTLKRDRLENEGDLLTTASTLVGYKLVQKNDLVINIMLAWNGSLGVSDYNGIVSPAYCVYRFGKNINTKYYHYLFKTDFMKLYFRSVSSGVVESRLRMYTDDFYRLYSFLPPLPEQTAIANYLDAKTEQINRFIAKKEKLIALLKEQKQAVINELLEDKEGKWEKRKLKFVGKMVNGFAFNSDEFLIDGHVKVIKIANIQPMKMDWNEKSFIGESYYEKLKQFSVKRGDLVFALTRPIIKEGIKVAFIDTDEKLLVNQRNAILKPRKTVTKDWLYYCFLTSQFISEFDKQIDKTGQQPNIATEDIGNIKIPFPSLDVQDSVVETIKEETSRIESVISQIEKEIEKVKELKQSLIAEVVTGRIKVV